MPPPRLHRSYRGGPDGFWLLVSSPLEVPPPLGRPGSDVMMSLSWAPGQYVRALFIQGMQRKGSAYGKGFERVCCIYDMAFASWELLTQSEVLLPMQLCLLLQCSAFPVAVSS